jgi:small subunit ribosomal protein S9
MTDNRQDPSDGRQSLADLAALTGAPAAAPVQAATPSYNDEGEVTDAPAQPETPFTPLREQILDAQGRAYATGRRKDAVARVWVKPGTGKITVNGRDQVVYFARPTLRLVINQVFDIADRTASMTWSARSRAAGCRVRPAPVKHGISQALTRYEPVLRGAVKAAGFLTRDPRAVERKKYGRAKARRSFQFSKR